MSILMDMEIRIKDNTVKLKYSFRALMIYENIANKSFSPKGISDVVVFFYSVVLATTKDNTISFDDFLDWLDDNRIAVVSVSDGKAVDQIFYLRKLRNGDQEEYRAWNRHECLTVWTSEQHDGRIFCDRCAELQLRFLQ